MLPLERGPATMLERKTLYALNFNVVSVAPVAVRVNIFDALRADAADGVLFCIIETDSRSLIMLAAPSLDPIIFDYAAFVINILRVILRVLDAQRFVFINATIGNFLVRVNCFPIVLATPLFIGRLFVIFEVEIFAWFGLAINVDAVRADASFNDCAFSQRSQSSSLVNSRCCLVM